MIDIDIQKYVKEIQDIHKNQYEDLQDGYIGDILNDLIGEIMEKTKEELVKTLDNLY